MGIDVIKRGSANYSQGPTIYRSKLYGGGSTETSFEGDYTSLVSIAVAYFDAGWETELTRRGPSQTNNEDNYASLKVTYNKDTSQPDKEPTVVWEIQEHPIEQNLLEATDRNIVKDLNTETKQLIEYRIKNPLSNSPLINPDDDDQVAQFDNARTVYNAMRIGIETRLSHTVTAKRTIIVAAQYTPLWTLDNVEKILSKNQLVGQYVVPTYLQGILPDSSGFTTDARSNITTYKGYFVHFPTYSTQANNKVQVSQDFVYNKWFAGPNGLYDVIE